MLLIVCYDVNTETREGRRRLRRVAKLCESMGQRVQKSVFECQVDRAQFEELERSLVAEIKAEEDNLRFYRLADLKGYEVREHGRFRATDFDAPSSCDHARTCSDVRKPGRFVQLVQA